MECQEWHSVYRAPVAGQGSKSTHALLWGIGKIPLVARGQFLSRTSKNSPVPNRGLDNTFVGGVHPSFKDKLPTACWGWLPLIEA